MLFIVQFLLYLISNFFVLFLHNKVASISDEGKAALGICFELLQDTLSK